MSLATSTRLKVGLIVTGAVGGAIAGGVITVLGKLVAGAPPATISNYVWNMTAFGLIGAVSSPTVTWAALRHVPLWRTVVEPLAGGVGGALLGVLLGSGPLFIILTPLGVGAAVLRLSYAHRDRTRSPT